jgi:hypothetical protein
MTNNTKPKKVLIITASYCLSEVTQYPKNLRHYSVGRETPIRLRSRTMAFATLRVE